MAKKSANRATPMAGEGRRVIRCMTPLCGVARDTRTVVEAQLSGAVGRTSARGRNRSAFGFARRAGVAALLGDSIAHPPSVNPGSAGHPTACVGDCRRGDVGMRWYG